MNNTLKRQKINAFHIACFICIAFLSSNVLAVVPVSKKHKNFTTDIFDLKSSINVEAKDKKIILPLPVNKIKKRLKLHKDDLRVEPISMNVFPSDVEIKKFTKRFSKPNYYKKSLELIRAKVKTAPNHHKLKDRKVLTFSNEDLMYIDIKSISAYYARTHHEVHVSPSTFKNNPALFSNFLSQVRPYIGNKRTQSLRLKINNQESISISKDLLPRFAHKRVKKHSIYRGPNCFHSAISFNSEALPKSNKINIKEEKNYHRAMLNYDELWRVLNSHFYEVDPQKAPLKFGDVLVFFDRVEGEQTSYKWIKHTTAYLFGPYTFSKGSKSANTPYSVNTLSEEWNTWLKYTKNMGVKVYRFGQRSPNEIAHSDLIDWLY